MWPRWLGPTRNGRVAWLPSTLPAKPTVFWEFPLLHAGLGVIAATQNHIIFGCRDQEDFQDVFTFLDADTGKLLWQLERLAAVALDYGTSPRATPLRSNANVISQSAFGHLLRIDLATDSIRWEINFRDDFPIDTDLPWGHCGSPLIAEEPLIYSSGGSRRITRRPQLREWQHTLENTRYRAVSWLTHHS